MNKRFDRLRQYNRRFEDIHPNKQRRVSDVKLVPKPGAGWLVSAEGIMYTGEALAEWVLFLTKHDLLTAPGEHDVGQSPMLEAQGELDFESSVEI